MGHRVFHQQRAAPIQKTFRQPRQQIQPPVCFPQQQATAIAGHRAAVETSHHPAREKRFKFEPRLGTPCHSKVWRLSYARKSGLLDPA
jgi:hypothetical protein